MARPARSTHSGKPLPSSHKANAAGYAKRHARKDKSTAGLSDVYDYQSQKVRRQNVSLTLDRDEAAEFDHGSDDEVDREALKARLIGENQDDEKIDPDDDEELDSDAAFEESDEERFAGFSFNSKSKQKKKVKKQEKPKGVRFADVDLNEDGSDMEDDHISEHNDDSEEEEEEEGDPDEFIDILDVLDGRGEPDLGDEKEEMETIEGAERNEDEDEDEAEDEDEDEGEGEDAGEEGSDEEGFALSADEEDAPEALEGLGTFISGLDTGKKRKADEAEASGDPARRKRRIIQERTEAGAENEFAAKVSGSNRLSLDDLLTPLTSQSSNVLDLKKSVKLLTSSKSAVKLSAPLPQRTQDRLDRQAAYEQTKEEVDKWKETMKRIKEAEHLSFPLQAQPSGKTSNLELAAKFKPTTELESAVDKLLKQAKMREEDLPQTEQLKMNHLSAEEVAARRAEVRKVRELMFRAEAKAKRVAKIKSKTYRRIKKKERAKLSAKIDGEVDEDDEEVRMKREAQRAMERATLRHKNTGKWAKAMRGRGELDEDQRREINEMLDRGEQLRRRIRGEKDSDASSGDDESDQDEDIGIEGLKARAFDELAQLKGAGPEQETSGNGKSVFDMKFMRDAAAREQREVDKDVDDFLKELGGDETEAGEMATTDGTLVSRTGGRLSFRPGTQTIRPIGSLASDTSSVTLKSTDLPPFADPHSPLSPTISITTNPHPPPASSAGAPSNPWLVPRDDAPSRTAPKKNELLVGKDSKAADKSKSRLRKRQKNREDEKEKAKDDAVVEISLDDVLAGADAAGPSAAPARVAEAQAKSESARAKANATNGASSAAAEDDSDANSEVEEQERALDRKGKGKGKGTGTAPASGVKAFQQRDLVALAFAGDNVVQEFAEMKRREIQADAPKTVDTTLPGWGAWGGHGARKRAPHAHQLKRLAGVAPAARADHGKAHVVISERRDKKAAKYAVRDLPYPYTSAAQYARSLETPLGVEWNTRAGFQRATVPRITKKMGTVINPLEKLY